MASSSPVQALIPMFTLTGYDTYVMTSSVLTCRSRSVIYATHSHLMVSGIKGYKLRSTETARRYHMTRYGDTINFKKPRYGYDKDTV